MIWGAALIALTVGLGFGLVIGKLAQAKPQPLPPAGTDLTQSEVERIAMERFDDPDLVRLAVDWGRLHRQWRRDVAMLSTELDDVLRKAGPMTGMSMGQSSYTDAEALAEQARAVYSQAMGVGAHREVDEDEKAGWLEVVRVVRS